VKASIVNVLARGWEVEEVDFALRHVCCLELRGGSRCANLEQELDNNTEKMESAERNSIERGIMLHT
jgi:hypothetical protein